MSSSPPLDHLTWRTIEVDGRRVNYGTAGSGLPVLFIHGWALGQHSYKRALKRLVHLGCEVYAPALPGFGGSDTLTPGESTLAGYARWLASFLDTAGVKEPVFAVGHSLGGGVVTKLAHDYPDRVGYLVLINSVGGRTWLQVGNKVRSMAERPLWDWAFRFPIDLLTGWGTVPMMRAILEDAVPNVLRNPVGVFRLGMLARTADLTTELQELRRRQLPVLVLWGEGDGVIPRASFDALCAAVGSAGTVVKGRHSWLLADPDAFGEVMANSVAVAQKASQRKGTPPPAPPSAAAS